MTSCECCEEPFDRLHFCEWCGAMVCTACLGKDHDCVRLDDCEPL